MTLSIPGPRLAIPDPAAGLGRTELERPGRSVKNTDLVETLNI